MKRSKFAWFLGFLFMSRIVAAAPPPDNASKNDAKLTESIVASMSNVDDLGMLIVWNGDGAKTVASSDWRQISQLGPTLVQLDSKALNEGTNYVIFVLYNQVSNTLGGGAKWSYSFELKKEGKTVWQKSDRVLENDSEIKYWKVFKMTPDKDGRVEITDELDKAVKKELRKYIEELEDKLNESADVATPF